MQEAQGVHHEQQMAQPRRTRGAAGLMALAPGCAHHGHQVVRPGVVEQLRETTATRRDPSAVQGVQLMLMMLAPGHRKLTETAAKRYI